MKWRQSDSGKRVHDAVDPLGAAVHRSVTNENDPGLFGTVLRQVSLFQILDEPVVLVGNHLDPVVEEVVELGGDADEVDGSNVEAVEHVFGVPGHGEPGLVVAEVTERKPKVLKKGHEIANTLSYYASSWLPGHTM